MTLLKFSFDTLLIQAQNITNIIHNREWMANECIIKSLTIEALEEIFSKLPKDFIR